MSNIRFSHNFSSLFNKITELLNDVERLKQALNGLSQLAYSSGSPSKRQSQLMDALQHQVRSLQQQLAVSTRPQGHPGLLVCESPLRNQNGLWLRSDPRT